MTLPAGFARLMTSPLETGSPTDAKTMGSVLVACLAGQRGEYGCGHDDINLERNQFGRESGEPLGLPLCIPVFDHDIAALDVTEVTQSLTEGLEQVGVRGQVDRQEAYPSDLGRLLGLGGERSAQETPRHDAHECPPIHH
ncbi:MAG TPA: hypothetical protein VGM03_14265 [Phycisphaerae bacterium]